MNLVHILARAVLITLFASTVAVAAEGDDAGGTKTSLCEVVYLRPSKASAHVLSSQEKQIWLQALAKNSPDAALLPAEWILVLAKDFADSVVVPEADPLFNRDHELVFAQRVIEHSNVSDVALGHLMRAVYRIGTREFSYALMDRVRPLILKIIGHREFGPKALAEALTALQKAPLKTKLKYALIHKKFFEMPELNVDGLRVLTDALISERAITGESYHWDQILRRYNYSVEFDQDKISSYFEDFALRVIWRKEDTWTVTDRLKFSIGVMNSKYLNPAILRAILLLTAKASYEAPKGSVELFEIGKVVQHASRRAEQLGATNLVTFAAEVRDRIRTKMISDGANSLSDSTKNSLPN